MGAVIVFLLTLAITIPLGVPIAFVLILCAITLMQFLGQTDMTIITQNMIMGANNAALMAIPFFMLAGEVMSRGGLSQRIVDFAKIVVGRFRGGLGYAAILASMIFAGLSGSPVADAAALGGIMIPLMVKNGYSKERSTGLLCSGAVIAPIIPPSIPMIVLATGTGLSVGKMFMAGLIPGIILGICLMVCWRIIVVHDKVDDTVRFTKEQIKYILKDSLPALFMPILIIGGIRFGIFTPTEAGAFAVVYALAISLFVYKEMKWKDLADVFLEGAKSTGIVMFIVASASAVGWLITVAQIPAKVVTLLAPLIAHPQAGVLGVGVALRNGFTAHADGVGVLGTPGADQTQIFADGQHLVQWDGDLAGKIDRSAICGRGDSGFQLCPACDGILGGGTGCVVERDFLNGEIIGKGAYFSGNFRVGIAVGFFIFRQFA